MTPLPLFTAQSSFSDNQCSWAQYKTEYRMINLIECLDQVGMLFLSDLTRQECTKYTN